MRKTLITSIIFFTLAGIFALADFLKPFNSKIEADKNTALEATTTASTTVKQVESPQTVSTTENGIKTVVFVTIDTLRADHLGYMGYPRNTSPFLDELASKSFLFKNSFTVYPATGPSHAAMFTGLHPMQMNINHNRIPLDDKYVTLAEQFKKLNYKTGAFVSMFSFNNTNFKQGFDEFNFQNPEQIKPQFGFSDEETPNTTISRRLGEDTIKEAVNWLNKQNSDEKIFLWIHLYDPHWKYTTDSTYISSTTDKYTSQTSLIKLWQSQGINPNFYQKPSVDTMFTVLNKYDSQIQYTDNQIKTLYTYFKEKNLNESALWIITSDHGEGLGSHNYFGHHLRVRNEQLSTPLIIHNPKQESGKIFTTPVENIDIFPTLGDLFGFRQENENALGQSLIPIITGQTPIKKTAFSSIQSDFGTETRTIDLDKKVVIVPPEGGDNVQNQLSIQDENYKYIHYIKTNTNNPPKDEFYNLKTDPLEQKNLIDKKSKIKDEMLEKLLKQLDKIVNIPQTTTTTDASLEEALRALGY